MERWCSFRRSASRVSGKPSDDRYEMSMGILRICCERLGIIYMIYEAVYEKNIYSVWKRRQTRIIQFSVKQDLVKIHCPTLFVSHTLGGRRVGWIMTFVISAILDGCARFACFSLLYLWVERRTVLDHLSNDFFSLPASISPSSRHTCHT